jgi:hypothetical protein
MESARTRARARELLGLGVALARGGALIKVSAVLAALTVLGAVIVALRVAGSSASPPFVAVSSATSSVLAWGAGVLAAFAAASRSLRRDRQVGVRMLVGARGGSKSAYVAGRVAGVAVVVAALVAGGCLVTGLVTVLAAARVGLAARALQGALAATAYGVAFAFTVAPLAMAALSARRRAGGYAWFVLLLGVPELLRPELASLVPRGWRDLVSIPSALAALRGSLLPPGVDVARLIRASFVLAVVAAVCLALARAGLGRVDAEEETGP